MSDLAGRVLSHIRDSGLFPRPGLALVAVSGGEDSVALLDLLVQLAPELGLRVAAAHVDHGIAEESSDVAEQVMATVVRLKVRGYLRSLALGPGASETTARRERYRLLRDMEEQIGADYLVTAHHADDQIETVLFRFLRGSAPAGLAGITPTGPRGLVRPLLPFSRAELHTWFETRTTNHEYRTPVFHDPANRDLRHDRSWLRERVLPLLRERFGSLLDANLLRGRDHAARERDAWASLIRRLPELDFHSTARGADVARVPLRTYDQVLVEALLRAIARDAGCVLGPRRAARLARMIQTAESGRVLELGDGWEASVVFDRLRIERRRAAPQAVPDVELKFEGSGSVNWGAWQISWRPETAGISTRTGLTTWVEIDGRMGDGGWGSGLNHLVRFPLPASPLPVQVRVLQDGDRLFPLGGVGHRSAHRLLMEAKVPRNERVEYPVMVCGPDLLWIPGVCRAATAVPSPGETALRIDARHA